MAHPKDTDKGNSRDAGPSGPEEGAATRKPSTAKPGENQTGIKSPDSQNKPEEGGLERRRSLGWENK